jgi:hypothetical protein
VPPALELAKPEQPTLHSFCPQAILDSFQGLACLITPQLTVASFSRNWNDTMARGGRNDLNATRLLNVSFLKLLADEEQQIAWRKLFEAMARGNLEAHAQVVDFTNSEGSRPFHLELSVHPLWNDGELLGYLVQGTDATAAHVSRLALLDRERKLKETKLEAAQQRDQFKTVMNRLGERQREQSTLANDLARTFAANPKDFPTDLCHLMQNQSDAMFCTLFLYDDNEQKLRLTAHSNAPDFYELTRQSGSIEIALGEGPCGMTAAQKTPRAFHHLLQLEDYAPWAHLAEANGFDCIWAFPLLENGQPVAVLQCYFADPGHRMSSDEQTTMATLCDLAAPLVRASEAFREATHPVIEIIEEAPPAPKPVSDEIVEPEIEDHDLPELELADDEPNFDDAAEPEPIVQAAPATTPEPALPEHEENEGAYRFIAGGLAEEFSNLLTGVLGHSSLAASEMGDQHVAIGDIRAIERAARNAAKLTKRLLALSGEARKCHNPIDLGDFLQRYSEHFPYENIDTGPVSVSLPIDPCLVHADAASLEVVLDGMLEHAFACMQAGTTFEWKLECAGRSAQLSLHYFGSAFLPRGWSDEQAPTPSRHRVYELFVSRESARALGGDIEIDANEGEISICLLLPLAGVLVDNG